MIVLVIGCFPIPFEGIRVVCVSNITKALDFLTAKGGEVSLIFISIKNDCEGFMHCLNLEKIFMPVVVYGKEFCKSKVEKCLSLGAVDYFSEGDYQESLMELISDNVPNFLCKDFVFLSRKMGEFIEKIKCADVKNGILMRGGDCVGKTMLVLDLYSFWGADKVLMCDCVKIPRDMIESTIFGHKAGHSLGSLRDRVGKLEESSGGVLLIKNADFLDDTVLESILRAIKRKKVSRLGSEQEVSIEPRVVFTMKNGLSRIEGLEEFVFPDIEGREEDQLCLIRVYSRIFKKLYQFDFAKKDQDVMKISSINCWNMGIGNLISCVREFMLSGEDAEDFVSRMKTSGGVGALNLALHSLDRSIKVMKYKISRYKRVCAGF